jgi:hypothetical protein
LEALNLPPAGSRAEQVFTHVLSEAAKRSQTLNVSAKYFIATRRADERLTGMEQKPDIETSVPRPSATLAGQKPDIPMSAPTPATTAPSPASPPQPTKANLPEQIHQAQTELKRLGCFDGDPDGQLNDATRNAARALGRHTGKPIVEINITDDFVDELKRLAREICSPERRPAVPVASRPSSRSKEVVAAPSRPTVAAEKPAKPEPARAGSTVSSGKNAVGF